MKGRECASTTPICHATSRADDRYCFWHSTKTAREVDEILGPGGMKPRREHAKPIEGWHAHREPERD